MDEDEDREASDNNFIEEIDGELGDDLVLSRDDINLGHFAIQKVWFLICQLENEC